MTFVLSIYWLLYFAFAVYCVVFCITSNLEEIKSSNFVAKVLYYHGLAFMLSLILVAVLSLAFVGAHLIKDAIFSN